MEVTMNHNDAGRIPSVDLSYHFHDPRPYLSEVQSDDGLIHDITDADDLDDLNPSNSWEYPEDEDDEYDDYDFPDYDDGYDDDYGC